MSIYSMTSVEKNPKIENKIYLQTSENHLVIKESFSERSLETSRRVFF